MVFALNHDKRSQIYFFCVKHQAETDFLKDVESAVSTFTFLSVYTGQTDDESQMISCDLGREKRVLKQYANSKGPEHLCGHSVS